jgi:hypothetical protein
MLETAMGTGVKTDSIEGFLSKEVEIWRSLVTKESLKNHIKMTSVPKLLVSDYIL